MESQTSPYFIFFLCVFLNWLLLAKKKKERKEKDSNSKLMKPESIWFLFTNAIMQAVNCDVFSSCHTYYSQARLVIREKLTQMRSNQAVLEGLEQLHFCLFPASTWGFTLSAPWERLCRMQLLYLRTNALANYCCHWLWNGTSIIKPINPDVSSTYTEVCRWGWVVWLCLLFSGVSVICKKKKKHGFDEHLNIIVVSISRELWTLLKYKKNAHS